jgi:hypothetical protein
MLLATAGLGGGGIALWTMGAANEPATDAQLSLEAGAGGLMLKGQTP